MSVVRSSQRSCISTGTPSAVRRTSTSTASAPCLSASAMPARLFSGRSAGQARWAMTKGLKEASTGEAASGLIARRGL